MSTRDGFKGAGTKESYERRKKKAELKASQANAVKIQPRTFQVGDVQMSESEYKAVRSRLGLDGGAGGQATVRSAGALAGLSGTREQKDVQAIEQQLAQEQAQQQVQATEPMVTEADIAEAVPQTPFLDQSTAIGAGVATAGATALGTAALTAKLGAMAGTAIAPGIGTAIGAGAGLIAGIGAYYTKIGFSKRGDVKQAKKVADIANRNFGQTIDSLNAGDITKDVALKRWREDKKSLFAAYRNLERDTNSQLDKWLSGGADELAVVTDYIQDLEEIYENEFILALAAPDPNRIRYYNPNQGVVEE